MHDQLTEAWAWIRLAASWAYHHPEFWPVVLALVTWLCKPRTPAEYARIAARHPQWFWARWVEIMRLAGALGLDPIKVVKIIRKLASSHGNSEPPPSGTGGGEIRAPSSKIEGKGPPSGPSILGAAALAGALLCMTQADCKPAESPRMVVRAAIDNVAAAVKRADIECATVAIKAKSVELAYECANAYDDARNSLLSAEYMVDAADAATLGRVPCALKDAMEALARVALIIHKHGGTIPEAVDDAAKFAEPIVGTCHV